MTTSVTSWRVEGKWRVSVFYSRIFHWVAFVSVSSSVGWVRELPRKRPASVLEAVEWWCFRSHSEVWFLGSSRRTGEVKWLRHFCQTWLLVPCEKWPVVWPALPFLLRLFSLFGTRFLVEKLRSSPLMYPILHSLIGGSDYKLIYRHYATLYFVFCVDSSESELGILDLIQVCVVS